MKIFGVLFIMILVVAFQLTILGRFQVFGAVPNLVLALTITWAVFKKEQKFDWFVLIPAIFLDFLIGRPFGLITLSLWLNYFFIAGITKSLFKQSGFLSLPVLSFFGVLFFELVYGGLTILAKITHLAGEQFYFSNFYFYNTLPMSIVYNVILCLLVFWIFKKIHHFLD